MTSESIVQNIIKKISKWTEQTTWLTPSQQELCNSIDKSVLEEAEASQNEPHLKTDSDNGKIETNKQFSFWCNKLEHEVEHAQMGIYKNHFDKLKCEALQLNGLHATMTKSLDNLKKLNEQYVDTCKKTTFLREASRKLMDEHIHLQKFQQELDKKLHFFTAAGSISQALTLPVTSTGFQEALSKIDECLEFFLVNNNFKESSTYLVKYQHYLARAMAAIRTFVMNQFTLATEQILAQPSASSETRPTDEHSTIDKEVTFALYYGKFRSLSLKLRGLLEQIEKRVDVNPDYESLLNGCQQVYFDQRQYIFSKAVSNALKDVAESCKADHGSLFRSSCMLVLHVCQDEVKLFHCFFKHSSPYLTAYLERVCACLYDSLRPCIVHVNHLETLAVLYTILRIEMLDANLASQDDENLGPFRDTVLQLLQDVQERLVFRTNMYIQTDILNYKPSPGDLAYPEKLELMEDIAQSLQEKRSESRCSQENGSTSSGPRPRLTDSPADLHAMWYPTVKRTLVCLSRLYRCVDRPVFQGLSQEALAVCLHTVSSAAQAITTNKTELDGVLFQIKHLIILREQIAPFQVDFTIKEMSLDFSKMKTAAFELLQKKGKVFSLSSNNALYEFLMEGAPTVKEQLLDSKKDVDSQLRAALLRFKEIATSMLVGYLYEFVQKAQDFVSSSKENELSKQDFSKAQAISLLVQEASKSIKSKFGSVQRSLQLYIANTEMEFFMLRFVKNEVVGCFVQLEQLISNGGYSEDELLIIACPTAEQISLILSSSMLTGQTQSTLKK